MYLHEICTIDTRYSNNKAEALKYFHKLLTLHYIRNFFKIYKQSEFMELCKRYPSIAKHGFDLKQAKEGDITLIKRS